MVKMTEPFIKYSPEKNIEAGMHLYKDITPLCIWFPVYILFQYTTHFCI